MSGTYVLSAELDETNREELLARFNHFCTSTLCNELGEVDFLGVTEGVLLAEDAHERGYETESWVLDSGVAPRDRDWIAQEKTITIQAYFKTEKAAKSAENWLKKETNGQSSIAFEADQDWNAKWKESFQGIDVGDGLRILPPWHEDWLEYQKSSLLKAGQEIIAINPGAGFGTGTHETTQLCLGVLRKNKNLSGKVVLDFGSGSGILGITAAKLGAAKVYCVEVDPLANDNALDNAKLNGVSERVQISEFIPAEIMQNKTQSGQVDILLANILRPILLKFAPELIACMKPGCELILSGLIESDLPEVIACYRALGLKHIERFENGEWRALYCRSG